MSGSDDSFATLPAQSCATRGVRMKPSSAAWMAGASSSDMGMVPWSAASLHQASIAPGIVTACGVFISILEMPRSLYQPTFALAGARPEPLRPIGAPDFGQ